MKTKELNEIELNMESEKMYAEGVIDGYEEGYEDNDGAQTVLELCNSMGKLIKELKKNLNANRQRKEKK